ncbi:uncharacterized protein MONBRDRAFT_34633 [Monosiga brevicollis MX1]|uniref:L-type lectin-like domain-containing protein n=1 Tax=Monosiga brevicollis TaxID=81824 RepID=A9VD00_MONBE|nr:uncharacterized protein MONBRDRAFT_34633 [Monosiga brevicollis MX1]EDQ84557.1 predicted protein [Monosiga brevicollis MX1]|eukprot:XP_001750584.1 hypothetical protein [Monosiga brevicollis MX1]
MRSTMTAVLLVAATLLAVVTSRKSLGHDPAGYVYQHHTVAHPYMNSGMDIPHWRIGGSTLVTDSYIRLTPDRQSRRGYLWNSRPYKLLATQVPEDEGSMSDFQLDISFHVHGQGVRLYGDGFAVWYTKESEEMGPVFGNRDKFTGLGIFFDTYSNVQQGHQQYISVMIGDGEQAYDHDVDGGDAKIAGCPLRFRSRSDEVPYHARIIYQDKILRMHLDLNTGNWHECFVVRRVHLPPGYHFGVTAATGDLADNHDIISFKVSEPVEMDPEEKKELMDRIHEDEVLEQKNPDQLLHKGQDIQYENPDAEGSWFWVGVVVVVLIAATFGGLFVYSKSQQKASRFNF